MAKIAAFFDIDHTLIEVNSGSRWLRHLWSQDRLTMGQVAQSMWWLFEYRLAWLDFEAMTSKVLAGYAGLDSETIRDEVAAWLDREIVPRVCQQARAQVAEHRDAGHVLSILSSATRYVSEPLAGLLGIEHVLCTELVEHEGRLTGDYVRPACYGPGKVVHAERFAAAHGVDLDASYFYSDSFSDLPMLQRVGCPRVVNPDPRLRRVAAQRGWGFERWHA